MSKEVDFYENRLLASMQNVSEAELGLYWTSETELLAKIGISFQPLKSSIIAIWQLLKPLCCMYFSIKVTQSNNYRSILDVIENRTTVTVFTCSKSTIETLGTGVKYV